MARPDIEFSSPEEELQYGVKVLLQAGLSPQEIEQIREKNKPGVTTAKELIGLRRYMVQELLAARMSNRQIANVLQLSKETVNADRHHNRELYTEKLLASADVHRARLLKEQMDLKPPSLCPSDPSAPSADVHRARLLKEQMDLKDKAMEAFEQSKKKRTTTIQDNGEGDGRGGSMIKIEESAGDSGFLNVAKNSLVEQARLLGLHELKREENQDKSYRQFLQDLSKTIEKEKEVKVADEVRNGALEVSFDIAEPPELGPGGEPLENLPKADY